jgi:predicted hotdog family 3-hydroxylacyl-ACP dehydratase
VANAIPVAAVVGQRISISVGSKDYWDSIAVLLSPDGAPVLGSDDEIGYHAAVDWIAQETGTHGCVSRSSRRSTPVSWS